MKRVFSLVLSFVVVLMMCSGVFAQDFNAQGGALVPNLMYTHRDAASWSYPYIQLTNITNETVTCQLRFYDADGEDITTRGGFVTGGVNTWIVLGNGGDIDLPPHSSRVFMMGDGGGQMFTIGHAEIKWSSTDTKAKVALVGGVTIRKKDTYVSNVAFLINQGNPF